MPSWGLSRYIKTNLQTACFTSYKAFIKKQGQKLVPCFLHDFWKKRSSCYILVIAFTLWDIVQYV